MTSHVHFTFCFGKFIEKGDFMSNKQRDDHGALSLTRTRKPFMLGYTVRPNVDGTKFDWTKIATAWEHNDGEGYEVQMDTLPVNGRLVLRTIQDDQSGASEAIENTLFLDLGTL
jgi:hypothetical protein